MHGFRFGCRLPCCRLLVAGLPLQAPGFWSLARENLVAWQH